MIYYLDPSKVKAAASGKYGVHNDECPHCQLDKSNLKYLGSYNSPKDAIIAAKQQYLYLAMNIDGCSICCVEDNIANK